MSSLLPFLLAAGLTAMATEPVGEPADLLSLGCTALCHVNQGNAFEGSDHHAWGYTCDVCHGGDPEAFERKAAHSSAAGFIGRPSRAEVVAVCGECHEPEAADLHGSVHIVGIETGGGAVCIDCHDNHAVFGPDDERSRIFRTQIAETCGECHPGPEAHFLLSEHEPATQTGEMKACYSCHGNHAISQARPALFHSACGECHAPDTLEGRIAQDLQAQLVGVTTRARELQAAMPPLEAFGLSTADLKASLHSLEAIRREAAVVSHTVNEASVTVALRPAEPVLTQVETAIADFDRRRQDQISALVFAWLLIVGLALLLTVKLKRVRRS